MRNSAVQEGYGVVTVHPHLQEPVEMVQASGLDTPVMPPLEGVFGLCTAVFGMCTAVLGTPQYSPRRAGGVDWEEGVLGSFLFFSLERCALSPV